MENIIIAGDFAPIAVLKEDFEKGHFEKVFDEVRPILENADYSLVNLEAPIVEGKGCPIEKAGLNLRTSKAVVNAIHYLGFKCVTLANNHFYDYGEEGAFTTMSILSSSNIDYVGAGRNADEASRILYKTIGDSTVAFINCCEHEYSIADNYHAGSNPLSPVSQYYSIKDASAKADYVIIIVHGGIEGYNLPSPRMQKLYRFFIDCGADLVVNHHQHCFSGYEVYNGKHIFYGLGNFCFDQNLLNLTSWYEGYLLKIVLNNGQSDFEMIPYVQCKDNAKVHVLENIKGVIDKVEMLNKTIADPVELEAIYKQYLIKTMKSQKYVLCPYTNKYLAALYVRGLLPGSLPKIKWRALQNKIACESHRDRFLCFLKNEIG